MDHLSHSYVEIIGLPISGPPVPGVRCLQEGPLGGTLGTARAEGRVQGHLTRQQLRVIALGVGRGPMEKWENHG